MSDYERQPTRNDIRYSKLKKQFPDQEFTIAEMNIGQIPPELQDALEKIKNEEFTEAFKYGYSGYML